MNLRNVLNEPSVTKLMEKIVEDKPEHVKAWFRSTLRTWFLAEAKAKPVACLRNVDPATKLMINALALSLKGRSIDAILDTYYHIVDYDAQPEWARKKLDENADLYWLNKPTPAEINVFRHWADYMMTLPERQIKHTVADMKDAVKAWDEMLRKAKVKADAFKGYELQDILSLKTVPFQGWKLYKLTTKDARVYEGKMMHHCVGGGGYDRADIWSLMNGDHHEVTLETRSVMPKPKMLRTQRVSVRLEQSVAQTVVCQARASSNDDPKESVQKVLNAIYAELGWIDQTEKYSAEDEDEDEDEDEGEGERDDEEDDEEDEEDYAEDEEPRKIKHRLDDEDEDGSGDWTM